MKEIDIKQVIESKLPDFFLKKPPIVSKLILFTLSKILKLKEINKFIRENAEKRGLDFITSLFDTLNFTYSISEQDRRKIPAEGKVVIVANHPMGGLDGLALVKAVREVRPDARIVANDLLMRVENLTELFLPLDIYSINSQRTQLAAIEQALADEQAVILFPSGKVSRLTMKGIRDQKWHNGAAKFSIKSDAPILPIFVKGTNSIFFYIAALINDKLGMLMLPGEIFRNKRKKIQLIVGDMIPANSFKSLKPKIQSKLLLQHIYKVGNGKNGNFNTEKTVIHPIDSKILKKELQENELLGYTYDDKKIFLVEYDTAKNVLREISRLRELTFRKVGEGTGKTYDMDIYDLYYKHIVLWDDENLEIVGSYRLGITSEIVSQYGKDGLYNSSQFALNEGFDSILTESIEVGRSFIQQKYWKSNALDYMWQGIGAFLSKYPNIKYLWGAVSISNSYSELAKALIISYYKKWYSGDTNMAVPVYEYIVPEKLVPEIESTLNSANHTDDFKKLKYALKNLNFSVPILFRRYTELCDYGGALFVSWCIDVNFSHSIDGLIILDLTTLKEEAKKRYYSQKSFINKSNESAYQLQEN